MHLLPQQGPWAEALVQDATCALPQGWISLKEAQYLESDN